MLHSWSLLEIFQKCQIWSGPGIQAFPGSPASPASPTGADAWQVNLRPPGFQPESTGVSIRLKKQKIQKWQGWKSNINIYQHMSAPYDFIKFNFAKNWQWKSSNDLPFRLQNSYCSCLTSFLPFFLLSVSGFDGWALHMRAGHMPTGKVTANPARQSQTPGFHPKPQLLPKDIKIFHTLQIISEMPDLKRPLRFKLFQIFQHLQLSPPAETPGVVNLRPPGFQPGSTWGSVR